MQLDAIFSLIGGKMLTLCSLVVDPWSLYHVRYELRCQESRLNDQTLIAHILNITTII